MAWHGAVALGGNEAVGGMDGKSTGNAVLVPALTSSVEPNGIPNPPADGAGCLGPDTSTPLSEVQDADPLAAIPPPSNSADEVCGVELAAPEHIALAGMGPDADTEVPGLMPGVVTSVAPNGIPVGCTGATCRKLSGEVTPIPGCELLNPLT